jgi:hypothetical protein
MDLLSVGDTVKSMWDGTFDGNHNSKITWDNLLDQSLIGAELYLDCMIGQTDHQRKEV